MFEVVMPKIGILMETGKIEKWLKKEGDKIEVGDILLEIMTDKVSMEVESSHAGILRKIVRQEDEDVPVLEVIAYIGEADEKIPETSAPAAAKAEAVTTTATTSESITEPASSCSVSSVVTNKNKSSRQEAGY